MKTYSLRPIKSTHEAYAFLALLYRDGLSFHPDDQPSSILALGKGKLFTDEEARVLEHRMAEVHAVLADPAAFLLTLDRWDSGDYILKPSDYGPAVEALRVLSGNLYREAFVNWLRYQTNNEAAPHHEAARAFTELSDRITADKDGDDLLAALESCGLQR